MQFLKEQFCLNRLGLDFLDRSCTIYKFRSESGIATTLHKTFSKAAKK